MLTKKEERIIFQALDEDNPFIDEKLKIEAMDFFVQKNQGLVISIIKQLNRTRPDVFKDSLQDGNMGLMVAIDRYDYKLGFRFATYATWWIKQHILRGALVFDQEIRIPDRVVWAMAQLSRETQRLYNELGRAPSIEELAKEMGFSEEKIIFLMDVRKRQPLSLHKKIKSDTDEGAELIEFITGESGVYYEDLSPFLNKLSPIEKVVLKMRFGIGTNRGTYSLKEIGSMFGKTHQRIVQIQSKAFRKLRNFAKRKEHQPAKRVTQDDNRDIFIVETLGISPYDPLFVVLCGKTRKELEFGEIFGGDSVADAKYLLGDLAITKNLLEKINKAVFQALDRRYWEVLRHYYGLGVPKTSSMEELANKLNNLGIRKTHFDYGEKHDARSAMQLLRSALIELRKGKTGLDILAEDAGVNPQELSADRINYITTNYWTILSNYYGIGTQRVDTSEELLKKAREEGVEYKNVRAVVNAKYKALQEVKKLTSGREELAKAIGVNPDWITKEVLIQIPERLREVLCMRYGLDRHRIFKAIDVSKRLAELGYTLPEGKLYGRKSITLLNRQAKEYLRDYLTVGPYYGENPISAENYFTSKRLGKISGGEKIPWGDRSKAIGMKLLSEHLGIAEEDINKERFLILTPLQLRVLELYYGLRGTPPEPKLRNIALKVKSEGLNDVRSKGTYTTHSIFRVRQNALKHMRSYKNGWEWLTHDTGLTIEQLKGKIQILSNLEWEVLRMHYGIDVPKKASGEEMLKELQEKKLLAWKGAISSVNTIRHAKVNALKRLKGALPESRFSMRKSPKGSRSETHPRTVFANMPTLFSFTIKHFCKKNNTSRKETLWQVFNTLEKMGIVAIERGAENIITPLIPKQHKQQVLEILESYCDRNDINRIRAEIDALLESDIKREPSQKPGEDPGGTARNSSEFTAEPEDSSAASSSREGASLLQLLLPVAIIGLSLTVLTPLFACIYLSAHMTLLSSRVLGILSIIAPFGLMIGMTKDESTSSESSSNELNVEKTIERLSSSYGLGEVSRNTLAIILGVIHKLSEESEKKEFTVLEISDAKSQISVEQIVNLVRRIGKKEARKIGILVPDPLERLTEPIEGEYKRLLENNGPRAEITPEILSDNLKKRENFMITPGEIRRWLEIEGKNRELGREIRKSVADTERRIEEEIERLKEKLLGLEREVIKNAVAKLTQGLSDKKVYTLAVRLIGKARGVFDEARSTGKRHLYDECSHVLSVFSELSRNFQIDERLTLQAKALRRSLANIPSEDTIGLASSQVEEIILKAYPGAPKQHVESITGIVLDNNITDIGEIEKLCRKWKSREGSVRIRKDDEDDNKEEVDARISSDAGEVKVAFLQYKTGRQDEIGKEIIQKLNKKTRFIILTFDKNSERELWRWIRKKKLDPKRFFIYRANRVRKADEFGIWARDDSFFLNTEDGIGIALLEREKYSWPHGHGRSEYWRFYRPRMIMESVERFLDKHDGKEIFDGMTLHKRDIPFDLKLVGGEVVTDPDGNVFVGIGEIKGHEYEVPGREKEVKKVLGAKSVHVIKNPLKCHLDLCVTVLPNKTVLIGDPALGEKYLTPSWIEKWNTEGEKAAGIEVTLEECLELHKRYKNLAKKLEKKFKKLGYKIERVPLILGRARANFEYREDAGAEPIASYNNVIQDGNNILMPVYGNKEADDAAARVYEKYGFKVIRVNAAKLANAGGGLRCLVNVCTEGALAQQQVRKKKKVKRKPAKADKNQELLMQAGKLTQALLEKDEEEDYRQNHECHMHALLLDYVLERLGISSQVVELDFHISGPKHYGYSGEPAHYCVLTKNGTYVDAYPEGKGHAIYLGRCKPDVITKGTKQHNEYSKAKEWSKSRKEVLQIPDSSHRYTFKRILEFYRDDINVSVAEMTVRSVYPDAPEKHIKGILETVRKKKITDIKKIKGLCRKWKSREGSVRIRKDDELAPKEPSSEKPRYEFISNLTEDEVYDSGLAKLIIKSNFWPGWAPSVWDGREIDALVAYHGEKPVAVCSFIKMDENNVQDNGIYVLKRFRRQGIGSLLREELISYLRRTGYKTLTIGGKKHNRIKTDDKAQEFHEVLAEKKGVKVSREDSGVIEKVTIDLDSYDGSEADPSSTDTVKARKDASDRSAESYFAHFTEEEAINLSIEHGVPILVTPTKGCINGCQYCGRDSSLHVVNMPWPQIKEIVAAFVKNRDRLQDLPPRFNWFDSDPLRDYYDPVHDKNYGDILELLIENDVLSNGVIHTSGWDLGSSGETARRSLKKISMLNEKYNLKIRVVFHINTESTRFMRLGKDQYTKNMKEAYTLAKELLEENVSFVYGSTEAYDVGMVCEITGMDKNRLLLAPIAASKFFKPQRRGRAYSLPEGKAVPANPETFAPANFVIFRPDRTIKLCKEHIEDGRVITEITTLLPKAGDKALEVSQDESSLSHPQEEKFTIDDRHQSGIEKTVFSPEHITTYRQCRTYRHPDLSPLMIKELIDNIVKKGPRRGIYFKKDALAGYRLAKSKLSGLILPYDIRDITVHVAEGDNTLEHHIENAVIVLDSGPHLKDEMDVSDLIITSARQKAIAAIKAVIEEIFGVDRKILSRDVFLPDPLLDNFTVVDEGKVFLIDPGFLVSEAQADDFYTRGRTHKSNNDFIRSLSKYGLSDEEIKDIQHTYYEASGVDIRQFDDEIFAGFEDTIKEERYYALGALDHDTAKVAIILQEHPEWAYLTPEELLQKLPQSEGHMTFYESPQHRLAAAEEILSRVRGESYQPEEEERDETILIDSPFTYDMLEEEGVASSFADKLLSILSVKKVVLAFEEGLGGSNSSMILDVFEEIEKLKKDPKYKRFLKNLTIITSSADKLPQEINKHTSKNTEVFMFARNTEREKLKGIEQNVHASYVEETEYDWNTYYPLAEIVTITLSQYLDPTTLASIKDLLKDLGIAPEPEVDSGSIIFTLLPGMEKHNKGELIKRYAALKRALASA